MAGPLTQAQLDAMNAIREPIERVFNLIGPAGDTTPCPKGRSQFTHTFFASPFNSVAQAIAQPIWGVTVSASLAVISVAGLVGSALSLLFSAGLLLTGNFSECQTMLAFSGGFFGLSLAAAILTVVPAIVMTASFIARSALSIAAGVQSLCGGEEVASETDDSDDEASAHTHVASASSHG